MFRPDRSSDRPVRHLEWRVRLMGAGALLALVGFYFDARWLVWIAVGVLVVGLFVQFVPERSEDEEEAAEG